ncbi:hypothetical protein GCM10020256_07540 [Streptomyces thermocoprophilus]
MSPSSRATPPGELADALKTVWETDPQQFYEHGYQELVNRGFRIDVAPHRRRPVGRDRQP